MPQQIIDSVTFSSRHDIGNSTYGQEPTDAAFRQAANALSCKPAFEHLMRDFLRTHGALLVLCLVGTTNFLDRHILGIALPSIRAEFPVSDALLGLLSGPAFAIAYALFGVPLALLADRIGRRKVIAGALACFSTATLFCGLSQNFWQLTAARFAVGVGEAGTTSPSTALIASLYEKSARSGPLSIFAASGDIGLFLAYFAGGWIAEHYGWRTLFIAAAMFGFIALAAVGLAVREPRHEQKIDHLPSRMAFATLLAQPGVRWILAGTAIASIGGYGALAFTPSFLVRSHHMTPAAIGFTLAIMIGIFGWAGTAFPGLLAQRLKPDDIGFGLRIASIALMLVLPFHIVFYLVPDLHVALIALIPRVFASAIFLGPCFAIMQHQASADMRSQATALLLLVLNLVGLSLGPQLVGIVSSLLQPHFGEEALRYALAIVSTAPVIPAAICFWLAAQALRRSTETG